MTTLNLPSSQSSADQQPAVRPMQVRQDARQVIALLELVFNQHLRGAGHHTISQGFSIRDFFQGRDQIVPGFVYSDQGRIVGNVSLLESKKKGRYLIANVAVHPDFRRRGIAREMMQEVIKYIRNRGGTQMMLQVETENDSARWLYKKLGFTEMGEIRDWRMNWFSLKTVASNPPVSRNQPDQYQDFKLRPLRSEDAQAAHALDQSVFPKVLNWPDSPRPAYFHRGLKSLLERVFIGVNHEVWVAENHKGQLVGIGIIENELGRPYNLKIRVHPDWVDLVERPLLAKMTRRLRYMRSKTITLQQDINQTSLEHLIREAGFGLKRNLTVMQLDL